MIVEEVGIKGGVRYDKNPRGGRIFGGDFSWCSLANGCLPVYSLLTEGFGGEKEK